MSQAAPATHSQEFNSEEIRVIVTRKPGCRIELQTIPSRNLVESAQKAAVKMINKETTLPGFRKGKAPDEIILKKFPHDVEQKFHKELADLSFTASQKLTGIPLLNNNAQITFEFKNQSPTAPELLFSFETEPEVPSVDFKGFQPKPVEKTQVTDQQINEAVRQMRFFYANWQTISDRTIAEGDYIIITLETLDDGKAQKVFDHIRFEVSSERMANWMKNLVYNAKSGDVLEGISEPDESASEEEKKTFLPKKVRVTIHKVEMAELPELNDEFAKKVGAADVPAMMAFISNLLQEKAAEKDREALREQVSDFLISNYTFDLPQSLVETEKKDRIQHALKDPQTKRKWDTMPLEERQAAEKTILNEASQAIRLFYLSRKVVNDAKIPISHGEVQNEAVATLRSMGGDHMKLEKIPKEIYALALSKVLLAKAQDAIIENALVK